MKYICKKSIQIFETKLTDEKFPYNWAEFIKVQKDKSRMTLGIDTNVELKNSFNKSITAIHEDEFSKQDVLKNIKNQSQKMRDSL